ncbi:6-hydroxymethylpterin diphosphokinase MptE-like protein [Aliarcobacter butzleri]|uniref:motility associated factor glycosyltransferase family protein n=1 Tax=Aliarcobacter butzleri TaxID=28197 RepID=UPI003B223799
MTQTKEQAQIQLQNALTTTFLANLVFLSEYDNELYHRVDALSRMIENGDYKERYALEFNMQDGEFDIYDIQNDKYLYDKKPRNINDDLVRKVEFNTENSILDMGEYFFIKNNIPVDKSKRFELDTLAQCNALTIEDAHEYTSELKNFSDNKKKKVKQIDKFIFLGTLLGRHIPRIAKKVDAKIYLVLERNLEIFRLSLFTVDYTILAQKSVIFSVMDDYLEEEKHIQRFLQILPYSNYLLKFSTTNINIEKYIDNILSISKTFSPTIYDYNRRTYIYMNRTTKYLKEYRTIQFNKIKESLDIFENTPILYLAAGPSLDENMEWIKENQDKFFIVTIGSAYKKLLNNDIKIDMITTLDEQSFLDTLQFDDESVSKISKETIILASAITYEKVLKKFNKENTFLYSTFHSFYKDDIAFSGYSIGEITLNILLHLNAKEVYTIGLDLALNQETGETHSKGASSGTTILNLEEEQNRNKFNIRKSLIKVKGNLKDEVFTTAIFYSSIKFLEDQLLKFDTKELKLFNLSKNGAYFEGLTPLKIEDLDIKSFCKVNKKIDLKTYLKDNSEISLDTTSKELLQKELDFISTELKEILEDIKSTKFKNYDEFNEKILSITSILYKNKFLMFFEIINSYYTLYIPYISYHFNDKKLKNEDKKLKKVANIFASQLTRICEDFKICLKRVL